MLYYPSVEVLIYPVSHCTDACSGPVYSSHTLTDWLVATHCTLALATLDESAELITNLCCMLVSRNLSLVALMRKSVLRVMILNTATELNPSPRLVKNLLKRKHQLLLMVITCYYSTFVFTLAVFFVK